MTALGRTETATLGQKQSTCFKQNVLSPLDVSAFRKQGWTFVPATTAFKDPVYSSQPDTLPAGESVVWAIAKARGISGLRYPAEDSVYEEPKLRLESLVP